MALRCLLKSHCSLFRAQSHISGLVIGVLSDLWCKAWLHFQYGAAQWLETAITLCAVAPRSVYEAKVCRFETPCLARGCQDLIYPMFSMSIVHNSLLLTPLGPDHPRCVSGNTLTYHYASVPTVMEHSSLSEAPC